MKAKQSLYIPLVKGNRSVGEHSVELMRQIAKGRRVVHIKSDNTIDIGVMVEEVVAEPEVEVVAEPEALQWHSKMKKAELTTVAEEAGLEIPDGATKAAIIELLKGL